MKESRFGMGESLGMAIIHSVAGSGWKEKQRDKRRERMSSIRGLLKFKQDVRSFAGGGRTRNERTGGKGDRDREKKVGAKGRNLCLTRGGEFGLSSLSGRRSAELERD